MAHELPLFGDFASDLVAGDSKTRAYAFIEFEDAIPESIFVKRPGKATPEWSSRFEHGFSQLVDWFFKLDSQKDTVEFEDKFGTRTIKHIGLLVIGRTQNLGKREEERLRWRQEHILINSKQIHCKTFDQLCDDVLDRMVQFQLAAKAEEKRAADQAGGKDKPPAKTRPDRPK